MFGIFLSRSSSLPLRRSPTCFGLELFLGFLSFGSWSSWFSLPLAVFHLVVFVLFFYAEFSGLDVFVLRVVFVLFFYTEFSGLGVFVLRVVFVLFFYAEFSGLDVFVLRPLRWVSAVSFCSSAFSVLAGPLHFSSPSLSFGNFLGALLSEFSSFLAFWSTLD